MWESLNFGSYAAGSLVLAAISSVITFFDHYLYLTGKKRTSMIAFAVGIIVSVAVTLVPFRLRTSLLQGHLFPDFRWFFDALLCGALFGGVSLLMSVFVPIRIAEKLGRSKNIDGETKK